MRGYCQQTCGRCPAPAAPPPPPATSPWLTYTLADKPQPRSYVVHRVPEGQRIAVDGQIDDTAWQGAPWTQAFVNILGSAGPAPAQSTRAKMLWDDQYLYVAANLTDSQVWANYRLHDSPLYLEPAFEVFIDPDGDNWFYYELEYNALAVTWDLFMARPWRNGGPALNSFEAVQPSESTYTGPESGWTPVKRATWVGGAVNNASLTTSGWTIEIALPWATLGQAAKRSSPPKPGDQWRLNLSRQSWNATWSELGQAFVKVPADQTPETTSVWTPQYIDTIHAPETWGYVEFSDAPATGGESGGTAATADTSWPARAFLMDVYRAETAFYANTSRFATSFEELGLAPIATARIQTTDVSFIATTDVDLPGNAGSARARARYYVTEQGRLVFAFPDGGKPLVPSNFDSQWG